MARRTLVDLSAAVTIRAARSASTSARPYASLVLDPPPFRGEDTVCSRRAAL
ncbi:Hypothetical protein A7982_05003 [Minicystis rosea]|nr:Hypothetical protein A7982_05003 [Minicystis rosea]